MSETKRQKLDRNSPEARAIAREIREGTFIKEGLMVAFPPCFPGATIPIVADEGHITALDITPGGVVYGGTSGRLTHLFAASFHGHSGIVFDMGTVAGADQCAALCIGKRGFLACVNGPAGAGRVISGELQRGGQDLIQEWGFQRRPFRDLGTVDGERILHAVAGTGGSRMVGVTPLHLFTVDFESSRIEVVGEVPGAGRLAATPRGNVLGADGARHLWTLNTDSRKLERRAVALPAGNWDPSLLVWSRSRQAGPLYTADSQGRLFAFDESKGFSDELARTPLAPVGPMAATLDGRLFGFCGAGIAKMFCYHPQRRQVANLGAAVSVIERRRYGYDFSDAVTGSDGEIYFGENDNLGHVWLYFPKIEAHLA